MNVPLVCGECGPMGSKRQADWHYLWKGLEVYQSMLRRTCQACLEEHAKHF